MSEHVLLACACLVGLSILSAAFLKGWQGWLALKERELEYRLAGVRPEGSLPEGMHRIEIADLRERIRKLEAIASGIDP